METKNTITVFEHQSLRINKGDSTLPIDTLEALRKFYGESGVPYYSLIHNGVKFNSFVGVIKVGKYTIEVLPKADNNNDKKENDWRDILIGMLRSIGAFQVSAPSMTNLKLKSNSILDLYIELFISEVEFLLNKGLIKQYHKIEGNQKSLKGTMLFSKNIVKNLVHQERFYVRSSIYDSQHTLNSVLYKTIKLLKQINSNVNLSSRIGSLLLNFPEMKDLTVNDAFFERIAYNRKNEDYKNGILIARLLLLNYHPDLSNGKSNVLALMFDMNLLWEQFIYKSLKKGLYKYIPEASITSQSNFKFWKPSQGNVMRLKPDIVIKTNENDYLILDTKWKNLNGKKPSPDDLRQMYTYSKFHKNAITVLAYPGLKNISESVFINETESNKDGAPCKIIEIPVMKNIQEWQNEICEIVFGEE
ncbi:MAG TPA: restriction endonuclease [Bacteroidia bacterium]|nr:restriction endonuclease [Bacteroidia bacterium]